MPDAGKKVATKTKGKPHRWKKGQSGNPRGRKPDAELATTRQAAAELVGPHVQTAVDTLVDVMVNGRSEMARKVAADSILDRRFGRAPESVEVTGADGGALEIQLVHASLVAAIGRLGKGGK